MSVNILKKIAGICALLLVSLSLMQFVWHTSDSSSVEIVLSSDKINLALRRTADLLLKEAGDSSSFIPPVEAVSNGVWAIKLENAFNYDNIPQYLQSSLNLHQISSSYDVALIKCSDGTLIQGYSSMDANNIGIMDIATLNAGSNKQNNITCVGRELPIDCYKLQVMFPDAPQKNKGMPFMGWFFGGALALTLYGMGLKWNKSNENMAELHAIESNNSNFLHFGTSSLNVDNYQLICNGVTNSITYREAKLLQYFIQNANQVCSRNNIIENVWADEGILVGRSVDMFVSRLRKLLIDDKNIQISAIHGIGYRFEVS